MHILVGMQMRGLMTSPTHYFFCILLYEIWNISIFSSLSWETKFHSSLNLWISIVLTYCGSNKRVLIAKSMKIEILYNSNNKQGKRQALSRLHIAVMKRMYVKTMLYDFRGCQQFRGWKVLTVYIHVCNNGIGLLYP